MVLECCYNFSYFVLFTYVFSLFLEVSRGAAALTHFSRETDSAHAYLMARITPELGLTVPEPCKQAPSACHTFLVPSGP